MDNQMRDSLWATKQIDLVSLIGQTTRLKKVASNEYAGPCPKCGGTDRLRVNSSHGFFCRQCHNDRAWYDAVDFRQWMYGESMKDAIVSLIGRRGIDPEQLAKIQAERAENERKELEAEHARQATARKTIQPIWKTYHQNLTDLNRDLWRERGVSDDWQDYYKVGYCPAREWVSGDVRFESDSLTIPYFRYTAPGEFECISIKHRLLLDHSPGGKYRPEVKGLGNQLYFPWYEERMNRDVLIVEGEIKAMVINAALWIGSDPLAPCLSVVGIAGAGFKPEHLPEFDGCERAWFIKDPDGPKHAETREAQAMAKLFGDRLQIIGLPGKVDDLITSGVLDGFDLLRLMRGYDA
jgi:hypothetical protein